MSEKHFSAFHINVQTDVVVKEDNYAEVSWKSQEYLIFGSPSDRVKEMISRHLIIA